jgi:molybdopterin converting factor small subunit
MEVPEGTTVTQLKELVAGRFPALAAGMDTAVVSMNKEFAFDDDLIPSGAEVALFPPVSGGM